MLVKLLKMIMFTMVLNIALTPWDLEITAYLGYAMILLAFALPVFDFCMSFVQKRKKSVALHMKRNNTVSLLLVLTLLASGLFHVGTILQDMDLMKAILSFIACYSTVAAKETEYTGRDLKHIFTMNKVLCFIYLAYAFLPFPFRYEVANRHGYMSFTMGMGNQNATSISILFCLAMTMAEAGQTKQRNLKLLNWVLMAALFIVILRLQSRTVTICCLFMVVTMLRKDGSVPKWQINVSLITPIIFFAAQWIWGDLGNVKFLGKTLETGRIELYKECLKTIGQNPMRYVFGSVITHRLENYHNAPLAVLMNLGIVGFVLFFMFWRGTLRNACEGKEMTMVQRVSAVAIMIFLVHSSTEAAPLLGAIPYSVQIIVFSRLMKDRLIDKQSTQDSIPEEQPALEVVSEFDQEFSYIRHRR